MKKTLTYSLSVFTILFGIWVSLFWDIPVDNQIAVFILTCLMFGVLILLVSYDVMSKN